MLNGFEDSKLISIWEFKFSEFGRYNDCLVLTASMKTDVEGKGMDVIIVCPQVTWFEHESGLYLSKASFEDVIEAHELLPSSEGCITKSSTSSNCMGRTMHGTDRFRHGEYLYQIVCHSGKYIRLVSELDPILLKVAHAH